MRRRTRVKPYPPGSCTAAVYKVFPWVPLGWGDALQWGASAHAAGLTVCDTPVKDCIAVWPQGKVAGPHGHVSAVVDVDDDGCFTVWEQGADGMGPWRDVRFGPGATAWFIHPPANPWQPLPSGTAGAGRGSSGDPIIDVMGAWDSVAYYWNVTAFEQNLRLGVIAGMLAGL